jgi:hypothetical protein
MVLARRTQRRLGIVGLAATLAAPVAVIEPAAAAILFTCDSVTGSAVFSPGLVQSRRPQSLSSGPTAPAGPADIVIASTSDTGVKANQSSHAGSLSDDGTKVAFYSQATNLDPADTATDGDIYVKDLTTGDIVLASSTDTGVRSIGDDGFFGTFVLSGDGTRVAFMTGSTSLDPGDTDGFLDVYVKDLTTGDITLASTSDAGLKGDGHSMVGLSETSESNELSFDGTKVAFLSHATNLDPGDTDSTVDAYVKDLSTGDITLASTNDAGVKGNAFTNPDSLSADGTKLAVTSYANNLDPADTEPPGDGAEDVYVKDLTTGDIVLASSSDAGVAANQRSDYSFLSADGTRVAFASFATNLDPGDTDALYDIYVKDLTTGAVTLASTNDAGAKSNAGGSSPVGSADITKVAFLSSSTNLDPAKTNTDDPDIYVKDLTTGDVTLASTSDTGVDGSARSTSMSADGNRVAFESYAKLDPVDTAFDADIYVKQLPAIATSITIGDCSNGQSGTASLVELRSYGARPLGCPSSLGGAAGNDYPDQTPVLVGLNPSLRIDWVSGPDSFGVAKLKMGTTGTQWRAVLAIQASPGHDTPATNQYLPAAGSGLAKTKLKGRVDWSALDSFNCTSGTADPLSWLNLVNNSGFIVKNA